MSCRHSFALGPHGMGDAAWQYALAGYAVLPLVRGGKKPSRMLPETGGVHHATTDLDQIREWWGADPAANVGIACGGVSGLAVIDLDVKGAANGVRSFYDFLFYAGVCMPAAPQVQTPSGGLHLWLRTSPGAAVPERPGILPGVDVKGDGGLVAAPPSARLHMPAGRPGERAEGEAVPVPYWWAGGGCPCAAPMAPAWLYPWLAAAPALGSGANRPNDENDTDDGPDLDEALAHGFEHGYRNVSLYRLACRLYRRHDGPDAAPEVWRILTDVWKAGDTAGMSTRELAVIAASARRFVQQAKAADEDSYRAALGWLRA